MIAHGVLHLMPRHEWTSVLRRMQEHTTCSGYNVVAVITDALPPPDDLRPFMLGLFREGELLDYYRGWDVMHYYSYILDDEHPGGIQHRHPINKIVSPKATT